MNRKNIRQKIFCILCMIIFCLSGTSVVSATEEGADVSAENQVQTSPDEQTTEDGEILKEEERPEPDAYFEPIQTNEIAGWPQGPAVWAESAVLMDMDSGAFLYSKNMDIAKYPASITKIMTALLVIENSRLDEMVTFSEHAIYGIERNSSHIGIRVGEVLSIKECLYGMMLESANEVCLAVAEHVGGSVEGFVEMMNRKATELGCTNTHFTNPNGLPDENHYTTAHDMALISRAAYNNPTFREVCRTQISRIPKTNICGEERWLNNHHKMLPQGAYAYDGCTGGKTGFTQAALNTLVTYAERNGRRLVCVSLRTNGPQVYLDTASLLDYGFNNFQNVTLYSRSTNPGADMLYPSLYFEEPCMLDALRLTCNVTLPVSATQEQMELSISPENNTISRTYLYSQYPVGRESIPDSAIKKLLRPLTDDSKTDTPRIPDTDTAATSTDPATANLLSELPMVVYVLFILLIALFIMEIILTLRRRNRRRKRRKKLAAKKTKTAKTKQSTARQHTKQQSK